MSGDTSLLEPIYADDYVLVRPNGDTLEKREILDDLRRHSMRLTSAMPAAFERASRIPASDSLLVHIENIRAFKAQTPNKNGLSYNEPISSSREIIVLTLSWLAGSGGRWPGRASLNSRIEINFLISLAR
jgi:hypothetical protein